MGFEFDSKIIPFAVKGFVQGIGIFIFSLIQMKVLDDDKESEIDLTVDEKIDIYFITLTVIGLIGHVFVARMNHRSKHFLEDKKNTVIANKGNNAEYYEF